jgi:hypothetical protein
MAKLGKKSFIKVSHPANPKGKLTSACTRLATARFFNYTLLAKSLLIEANLAHPQAGNARGWAAELKLRIGLSNPIKRNFT